MSLESMKKANPEVEFYTVEDAEFAVYGRVLPYDPSEIMSYVSKNLPILENGSAYCADIEELHNFDISRKVQKDIFGWLPMQVGLVHGKNQSLTGIEFHQGSEVNVAVEDCVLLLGKTSDMEGTSYAGEKAQAIYLKKGDVVEIYSTTLHYTPLQVSKKGFSTLVYLLEGTNTEIPYERNDMLTKKNKWYICHASQTKKIEIGNIAGLTGELRTLRIPEDENK